jgi:hypothetical protein
MPFSNVIADLSASLADSMFSRVNRLLSTESSSSKIADLGLTTRGVQLHVSDSHLSVDIFCLPLYAI